MSATDALTIRPLAPDDLPSVLRLLERTLQGGPAGERTAGFFRWKHHDNPFGESLALVAVADDEIVGLRTLMRWRFTGPHGPVTAVRAVDTATDPDHQGRGIFTRLTREALERLRGEVDLVFNTPNRKSLPGYLKMGWEHVGSVPVAVRPVRPRFLWRVWTLSRDRPPVPSPPCGLPPVAEVLPDPDLPGLLDACDRGSEGQATPLSPEYLRWRYAGAPGLDYRAVAVREGGRLRGLAIGRPRWRGGLAELTLSEVLVPAGDTGTARHLLRRVARGGTDHVATVLPPGGAAARVRRRVGYLTVPRQGITLVVNPLSDLPWAPTDPTAWALGLGDLEVF